MHNQALWASYSHPEQTTSQITSGCGTVLGYSLLAILAIVLWPITIIVVLLFLLTEIIVKTKEVLDNLDYQDYDD
jgi:hypothetical protein